MLAGVRSRGAIGIGCRSGWKLTLNDFSTLSFRAATRLEGRVLNFNVFNPEYQIFGHFSRSAYQRRHSATPGGVRGILLIRATLRDDTEGEKEKNSLLLENDPYFAARLVVERNLKTYSQTGVTPDVGGDRD